MWFIFNLWACTAAQFDDEVKDVPEKIEEPDPIYWEACSYQEGDHICDFTYANAMDTTTTLYDYYGEIVVIKYMTEWCPYCRDAAEGEEYYIKDGTVMLSVMIENQYGLDPRQEDAERWSNAYGLDPEEVLRAGDYILDSSAEWGPDIAGFPSFIIVDQDMNITHKIRGWSLQLMKDSIAELKSDE